MSNSLGSTVFDLPYLDEITSAVGDCKVVPAKGRGVVTDVHRLFSGAELDGVLRAYAWGIKVVFAITIAACGLTVPFSLCNKWTNVNAKKPSGGGAETAVQTIIPTEL